MDSIFFLGLSLQAWATVATLITVFVMLVRSHVATEVIMLGGVTILFLAGVVSEKEVLEGFGSEPVGVHAAFFIVAAGLIQTGAVYWLAQHGLGMPGSYLKALFRLMVPVSIFAAFLNSVNVVMLFIDTVRIWARKLNVSPSKLLVPLSYAATMGGMCTLLGNSSNLVVAGLYMDQTGESMNMFGPLLPGVILTMAGVLIVILMRRYIPERKSPEEQFETISDYTVELLVPTDNEAVGQTVEEAGLLSVRGGSLVEIVRFDKEIITPVPADEFVMGGDRLIYAGQITEILELKNTHHLAAADHHVWSIDEIDSQRKMRTAYISFGSDLIGQTIVQSGFESDNDVVLVAVARQGQRVEGQPREIILQAGDTLLLECPPKGDERLENNNRRRLTFFDSHFVPQISRRTLTSAIVLVMMFVLSSFRIMPLMAATMLAAGAVLLLKCCRVEHVVRYIEWELLMVIGCTMVFSTAITNTGVATVIANGVLDLCGNNPFVVLAVMCALASLISEFITDVGAAAALFPIIWQQVEIMGCNPMPFVISLMLCVSISYSTPIGSSTHMLIFGPSSLRFTDFAKIGVRLHIIMLILCVMVVNLIYPMYK